MGYEHFYELIDRPAVDKLLGLTWPQFHRKYGWSSEQWGTALEFLEDFALDDENDLEQVASILKTRTLRWTMLRSSPQFFFLHEMLVQAPDISKRSPGFGCPGLTPVFMFLGAAANAFLDGRLSKRTLHAVFALHGGTNGVGDLRNLELPTADLEALQNALEPWVDLPGMFAWQKVRGEFDDYNHLGLPDTQRFLDFVQRSWSEKWPCSYLNRETLTELPKAVRKAPMMRDNKVAKSMFKWLRKTDAKQVKNMAMLRYFG